MSEVGTLRELNVKPGDVVRALSWGYDIPFDGYSERKYSGVNWTIYAKHPKGFCDTCAVCDIGYTRIDEDMIFRIISRAAPIKYGPWKLATPDAMVTDNMQVSRGPNGEVVAYRVPVEPKVEEVTLHGSRSAWSVSMLDGDTHKITFNVVDGEPDCSSVKMEKL